MERRLRAFSVLACQSSSHRHKAGGDVRPPFRWDDERRFAIRAELDAAFFHLYLPCDEDGQWKPAEREFPEQRAALKRHFATPRDAVAHILDQFPLVRQRDEQTHGRYRTRDRILEIYDQMLDAQRTGRPYRTALDPPPGDPRAAHPASPPPPAAAKAGGTREKGFRAFSVLACQSSSDRHKAGGDVRHGGIRISCSWSPTRTERQQAARRPYEAERLPRRTVT